MNPIEAALRRLVVDMAAIGRRWAVVGGLAVSARAEPRTTRDVDVVVAVGTDVEAEETVHALHRCGYRVWSVVEQEAAVRLATARLSAPPGAGDGIIVDLLFASSGIEPEIVSAAEEIELVPELTVPVARLGYLLALKVLARDDRERPQDWDDSAPYCARQQRLTWTKRVRL